MPLSPSLHEQQLLRTGRLFPSEKDIWSAAIRSIFTVVSDPDDRHPSLMNRIGARPNPSVMHLISSLTVGGAERLLIDLVKCGRDPNDTGVAVIPQIVVVMNNRVDRQMATELEAASVPVYYLSRPESSRDPRYFFKLARLVRLHNVSIIHSHTYGSKYWSALCRVIKFDLKLAHTFHDTRIELNSIDLKFHNAMVNVTIAISRPVADEARSLGIRRIQQIENGVATSEFHSVSPQPLGRRVRIISVARLFPEKKGQDILIRAIRRCVDRGLDVECTFVGSPATGDFDTLPKLEALVLRLELTGRVRFVQGRTDVATLLSEANIFVLPSRWEGFGLALVEAMAAGVPVIASDIDGPADIITDGVDGLLFASGLDEVLADKIALLIGSPSLAERLSENGRRTAEAYDITKMHAKYMATYLHLNMRGALDW